MELKVANYFELKQQQKEIEAKLAVLRDDIVNYLVEQGTYETMFGEYKVKTIVQQRHEYNDQKLLDVLPDPEMWRLLSKVDNQKLKSLFKLKVLSEEQVAPALTVKQVMVLQVEKV